jgi:hypothetical protein
MADNALAFLFAARRGGRARPKRGLAFSCAFRAAFIATIKAGQEHSLSVDLSVKAGKNYEK